jgi:hypothetical protein
MAVVKDIKKGYCDEVYIGLSDMKERLLTMRDNLALHYGGESEIFGTFERHLCELVDQINWKLQILSHACPYDWKGSSEYEENIVSVGPTDNAPASNFSGGYLGG